MTPVVSELADRERDPNTPQTRFLAGGVLHALVVRTTAAARDWRRLVTAVKGESGCPAR
jgi:hypothetical protein